MDNKKIVGIGEILWDVLPQGKALGGAPANFAYHAAQFGLDGYAVSAIGNDLLGNEIIDVLAEKKLHYLIDRVDFPTGTVQVCLDKDGIPQYDICQNVAWDNIPFTSQLQQLAKECKAVCFGSLAQRNLVSRTTINRFLDEVPKDAYKIFDINLRQNYYDMDVINHSISNCNILKINDDETHILSQMYGLQNKSEEEVCMYLLEKYHLEIVIETRGAIGSYVLSKTAHSYLPTPTVKVVDTVGAGDSFTGAFIAAIINGKSISEAHEAAVRVSAYVCSQKGAMPDLSGCLNIG